MYLHDVVVRVDEFLRVSSVRKFGDNVRKISPIRPLLSGDQLHSFLHQRVHLLANMIRQIRCVLPHHPLEVTLRQSVVFGHQFLFSVSDWGKIGHDVPDCDCAIRSRTCPTLKHVQND